tara:strand:+ start:722 stop:898 length:177 start_codon:yes stop_codon:yes gene_type:complete
MPLPFVIDALRALAPDCPGGEAVLLEAAEHLTQMVRALSGGAPPSLSEWQLPPAEPTR